MFTSRAEYRILLRQDDADQRFTPKGFELGLADKRRYDLLMEKVQLRDEIIQFVSGYSIKPDQINDFLESKESSALKQGVKLVDIISRPQISLHEVISQVPELQQKTDTINNRREEIVDSAEILIKYSGYIERERIIADKFRRLDDMVIENKFDYLSISTISTEARHKLSAIKPKTIGQASRIPGVSPSDISILLVMLGR
jgi:tRNA uridine 5-carboxymethylaminomethyl modification enzyme